MIARAVGLSAQQAGSARGGMGVDTQELTLEALRWAYRRFRENLELIGSSDDEVARVAIAFGGLLEGEQRALVALLGVRSEVAVG